jgi:hypothetical protein
LTGFYKYDRTHLNEKDVSCFLFFLLTSVIVPAISSTAEPVVLNEKTIDRYHICLNLEHVKSKHIANGVVASLESGKFRFAGLRHE